MPRERHIELVDVGTVQHQPGRPFSAAVRAQLERLRMTHEGSWSPTRTAAFGSFIQALLDRGHVVEQEATIRSAVERTLTARACS